VGLTAEEADAEEAEADAEEAEADAEEAEADAEEAEADAEEAEADAEEALPPLAPLVRLAQAKRRGRGIRGRGAAIDDGRGCADGSQGCMRVIPGLYT
jgi:hypothetical protein